MKKITAILVLCTLVFGILSGCGAPQSPSAEEEAPPEVTASAESEGSEEESPASVQDSETPAEESFPLQVGAMKGPTAMGMVHLMKESEKGTTAGSYQFTLGGIDEMVASLAKGDLDIAAVPANLSSVLYHNTEGKIQVLAINTLGVLYVVDQSGTVASVEDLKGKTLYSTGKGATPEFSLNYVLEQHGLDPATDLTIEYKSEAAEIIPLLVANPEAVALLPQPFATVAQQKIEGLHLALDWTKEWEAVAGEDGGSMVTGVLVVQKEFAERHPEQLATFVEEYRASTEFTQTNVKETAQLVEEYGIVDAPIAEIALPLSNITFLEGKEMKSALEGYLQVLFSQDPKAIGGSMPDEAYYFFR